MLNSTHKLNQKETRDLERLKAACKKVDGSIPNLYMYLLTQRRSLPTSLMHYEKHKMMGFLSVYFFYQDAVEVAVLVHPKLRRQGIAKRLLKNIIPLVHAQGIHKLIFTVPAKRNESWLTNMGFRYDHSEYFMERHQLTPLLNYDKGLMYRAATLEDIPILCALDEACFAKKQEELEDRLRILMNDRNYLILLAYLDNRPVGKAHFRWEPKGATLSDIAIIPSLQGQGLGTSLIAHCINHSLSEGKPHLNLDVETHNQRALELYARLGFQVKNACDYWEISIEELVSQYKSQL